MSSAAVEAVLSELPEDPRRAGKVAARVGLGRVGKEARRLGLSGLLGYFIPEDFPPSTNEVLAARFREAQARRTTVEVLANLDSAGVQALVLKGMSIARLYPMPWLRPSCDVDILVSREALDDASRCLESRGWKRTIDAVGRPLDFGHDRSFMGPQGQVLELHYKPSWHFQARFDVAGLFARSRVVSAGGVRIRVLGEADSVVHQCVHAGAHFFEGAKWLFDLKLQALQGLDWEEVAARAREARVCAVTGMALREAGRRVRAPVPADVLVRLGPGRVRRLLTRTAGVMPERYVRTRSGALDVLLPDGLSRDWWLRWAAPPVKRVRRLREHLRVAQGRVSAQFFGGDRVEGAPGAAKAVDGVARLRAQARRLGRGIFR